ncbi:MAG: sulfite exporter TauE/SafE family protein [Acidimicrobiales bacterium]
MTFWEALLLVGGGGLAGVINAMAGGGSSLTVPLLVLAGVPGNAANGSNRVGILASTISTTGSFHMRGVTAYGEAASILAPVVAGSVVGSLAISRVGDDQFETIFGLIMLPIIFLSIREPKPRPNGHAWSRPTTWAVFFAVGIYGGAVQAGVGLILLAALTRSGSDLVTANVTKVLVTLAVTAAALPVFIINGDVRWGPALVLAAGLVVGGWVGARIAVEGGERVIRAVMLVAAIGLAGRLLGFYG